MRKFKLFFYPIYLIAIFLVMYYSMDILANMDVYKEKVYANFFRPSNSDLWSLKNAPYYLMCTFLFLGTLMLVELISENLQIFRLKSRLKKAEEEVTKYKAKLYDKSQVEEEDEEDHDEYAEEDEE